MFDYSTSTVGIDLGDRKSVACIYANGTTTLFEFAMTPEGVEEAFPRGKFGKVALEAGAQSGWVSHVLEKQGYAPLVANPRKLNAIFANERKSDRNDAILIAKLAAADSSLLYPITHRSALTQLALNVLRARDAAVAGRVRLTNTIRSMGKSVGFRYPPGTSAGFAGKEHFTPPELGRATEGLFAMCRSFNAQIKAYDGQLEEMCETEFPDAGRLRQVNGVGPVVSLAFVLTLDTAGRFKNGRSVAAYLGLTPRRDQSGNSDKQLRISKTGNGFARRLLVQAAQHILGPRGTDCDLRRWGRAKLERGGKNGRKRVVTAVARKLAVLLFRLWKTGTPWVPLHNAEPTSTPPGVASSASRPDSAVSSDCDGPPDAGLAPGRRPGDGSTPDGQDPIMHREPEVPNPSADRSVGQGTAARKPKEKQVKAPAIPQRPRPGAQSIADTHATNRSARNAVVPGSAPPTGQPQTLKTAAFEGVVGDAPVVSTGRFPKRKAKTEVPITAFR